MGVKTQNLNEKKLPQQQRNNSVVVVLIVVVEIAFIEVQIDVVSVIRTIL